MNYSARSLRDLTVLSLLIVMIGFDSKLRCSKVESKKINPVKISIIVASTRATTTGKQIAQNIQTLLKHRSDITTEIIYIADYQLPFYTDAVSPASRAGEIVDSILKKWSDCIKSAQAFIIVSPEYNAGYPASLKNALDSLYVEWNGKPVAFVAYSGGPSGGTSMISQLTQVVQALQMVPVATSIKIPCSWKAFNDQGDLICAPDIAKDLNMMIDELIKAFNL